MEKSEQMMRAIVLNLWNNTAKGIHTFRNKSQRCCLCVAEDTACYFGFTNITWGAYPHSELGEFLGININSSESYFNPIFPLSGANYRASTLNDGGESIRATGLNFLRSSTKPLSHKEIAIIFCDLHPNLGDLKKALQKKLNETK